MADGVRLHLGPSTPIERTIILIKLVQRWFGKPQPPESGGPEAQTEEIPADLHAEFCRTFCHKPGVNFMEFLKANGVTRMINWLRPAGRSALPGAFIRLAVDLTRNGGKLWELQTPIVMNYEGSRNGAGIPDQESLDALSVLAQILEKPIKLYYHERQDGPLMVMMFEP